MNKLKFLKALMVALVAFATIGCGSSNSADFYTGGIDSEDPDAVGGLVFQIHREPQVSTQQVSNTGGVLQGNVPAETAAVGFVFYRGLGSDGVYNDKWMGWTDRIFSFADGSLDLTVNVTGVDGTVHYAVIIAYDKDNMPIGIIYSPPFTVVNGRDASVALGGDENYGDVSLKTLAVSPVVIDITGNVTDQSNTGLVKEPLSVQATFSDGSYDLGPLPITHLLYDVAYAGDKASYAEGYFTGIREGSGTFDVTFLGETVQGLLEVSDNTKYSANLTFVNNDQILTDNTTTVVALSFEGTLNDLDSTPVTPSYAGLAGYGYNVTVEGTGAPAVGADGSIDFTDKLGTFTVKLNKGEGDDAVLIDSFTVKNYNGVQFTNTDVTVAAAPYTVQLTFTGGVTYAELLWAGYSVIVTNSGPAPDGTGLIDFTSAGAGSYGVSLNLGPSLDSFTVTKS